MKCINSCVECGYYIRPTDACTCGANKDPDPEALFFSDCPLKDAQAVRHGRWVEDIHGMYYCTNCGGKPGLDGSEEYDLSDFCPRCGAEMDKEGNNDTE